MFLRTVSQAMILFAVTNIDDLVILALFFARGAGHRRARRDIAAGQALGFAAILAVAVAAAAGVTLLPPSMVPYLGLLPLALGVRAAVQTWRHRHDRGVEQDVPAVRTVPRAFEVAGVTFANGGDNVGVYVPVFASAGLGRMTIYLAVFLVLLAGWIVAARFLAGHPAVAPVLSRWGHILLPVVLVGLGVGILVEGGAFGL